MGKLPLGSGIEDPASDRCLLASKETCDTWKPSMLARVLTRQCRLQIHVTVEDRKFTSVGGTAMHTSLQEGVISFKRVYR